MEHRYRPTYNWLQALSQRDVLRGRTAMNVFIAQRNTPCKVLLILILYSVPVARFGHIVKSGMSPDWGNKFHIELMNKVALVKGGGTPSGAFPL